MNSRSVTISITGKDQITAGDFQKFISGFRVFEPWAICNLDPKLVQYGINN
jgi:DNA-directed RNA polymerase subunit alpha